MKTEFFVTLLVLLTGCQTTRPRPAPARQSPPPIAAFAPVGIRSPETIKTYAVGAYVDPDDESVRHEAHLIHRLERPSNWNLTPAALERGSASPTSVALTPLVPPPPALTPILTPAAPTAPSTVASAIPVITPPASTVTTPPVVVRPSAPVTPPPAQLTASEPILTPNADGAIDLAALEHATADDDSNPFAVRSQPPSAIRELSVRVGGVFSGDQSGALVNDRPLLIGDSTESLTLTRVESDAAVFRVGTRLLRLPVSAKPVQVRLAP